MNRFTTCRYVSRPIAIAVFAGSMLVVPLLGTEFLPELDEGSITIQAVRDPSVSLTRSIDMQRELERTVKMSPEVTSVVSRVGRAEVGSDPMGVNLADIFVMLKPRSEWRAGLSKQGLIEEIEHRIDERVPGVDHHRHIRSGDKQGADRTGQVAVLADEVGHAKVVAAGSGH